MSIQCIIKHKKGVKGIYNILKQNTDIPSGQTKWNRIFNLDEKQWSNIYKHIFNTTKNSDLLWFQFRINHSILPTGEILHKIGLSQTNVCTFCKTDIESLQHVFWECQKTKNLLQDFINEMQGVEITLNFDKVSFIFGEYSGSKNSKVVTLLALLLKRYIYTSLNLKSELTLQGFKAVFKQFLCVERLIALKNNRLQNFNNMWQDFAMKLSLEY